MNNINLDQEGSGYCGMKEKPPRGRNFETPGKCFKTGFNVGYVAGIKKGKNQSIKPQTNKNISTQMSPRPSPVRIPTPVMRIPTPVASEIAIKLQPEYPKRLATKVTPLRDIVQKMVNLDRRLLSRYPDENGRPAKTASMSKDLATRIIRNEPIIAGYYIAQPGLRGDGLHIKL